MRNACTRGPNPRMEPMQVVGLVSGGKDSIYNLLECTRLGHHIVCLANLCPPSSDGDAPEADELDSHCFQTVGFSVVPSMAECMDLPLVRRATRGVARERSLMYFAAATEALDAGADATPCDEVEDLYHLLREVKARFPHVNAVSCGAILSTYQRLRVEAIAARLGLTVLAFLWQRDQQQLLDEMLASGLEAVLVKVAACGLSHKMLGKDLTELRPALLKAQRDFGVSVVGEGGEYESCVTYCPGLFTRGRLRLDEVVKVNTHGDDKWNVCAFLHIARCSVQPLAAGEADPPAGALEASSGGSLPVPAAAAVASLPMEAETTRFVVHVATSPSSATATAGRTGFLTIAPTLAWAISEAADATTSPEDASAAAMNECTRRVLEHVQADVTSRGACMADLLALRLSISHMSLFAPMNDAYRAFFLRLEEKMGTARRGVCPVRSCVQVPVMELVAGHTDVAGATAGRMQAALRVEGLAFAASATHLKEMRSGHTSGGVASFERSMLHVQSLSRWAPLCIGPYCQSNSLRLPGADGGDGPTLHVLAGQIGLVPETMRLVGPRLAAPVECSGTAGVVARFHDFSRACFDAEMLQSLRNVSRVLACASGLALFEPPSDVEVGRSQSHSLSDSDRESDPDESPHAAGAAPPPTGCVCCIAYVSTSRVSTHPVDADMASHRHSLVGTDGTADSELEFRCERVREACRARGIQVLAVVRVPQLPRGAAVEIEACAWTAPPGDGDELLATYGSMKPGVLSRLLACTWPGPGVPFGVAWPLSLGGSTAGS